MALYMKQVEPRFVHQIKEFRVEIFANFIVNEVDDELVICQKSISKLLSIDNGLLIYWNIFY